MKAILWSAPIVLLASLAGATVNNYTCVPTGIAHLCVLEHVYYIWNQTTSYIFPKGYSHVRIGNQGWKKESIVHHFDAELYSALGQPDTIEINNVMMDTLVIPRTVQLGNFANNYLNWFSIEPGKTPPELIFLDLAQNEFTNLTNLSSLVNLEALYLQRNLIKIIEQNVLKSLTKLKVLKLDHNLINRLSGEGLPHSLFHLGLFGNKFKTLNYSDLYMPSVEILNMERNELESIDASALILAMPKLKTIRLDDNYFGKAALTLALQVFKRNNVSYHDEGDNSHCLWRNDRIEGVCQTADSERPGWITSTALTVLTLLVATVFVLTVRWVFISMKK